MKSNESANALVLLLTQVLFTGLGRMLSDIAARGPHLWLLY